MSISHEDFQRLQARADASRGKLAKAGGVAPDAVAKPNPVVQPVAADAGEDCDAVFRVVRYKSFRVRTVDQENWFSKQFTDALVAARILFDDSPKWCRIEIEQIKVRFPSEERTEIVIEPWP